MPLHALYDPRRSHELVIDAKGRLVTTSYAEWCSLVDWLFEDLPPHASILSPISNPSRCINVVAELDFRWRVRASLTDGLALLRRALLKAAHEIWRGGTVYLKSRAASASCFVRGAAGKDRTRSGCDTQGPADGD